MDPSEQVTSELKLNDKLEAAIEKPGSWRQKLVSAPRPIARGTGSETRWPKSHEEGWQQRQA